MCGLVLAFAPQLGAQTVTATIPVGNVPQAVALNPVTNKIYVANFVSNTVTVIDGATNATITVATENSPTALAVNPVTNKIYVANFNSASVTVIDGITNATTSVTVGRNPAAVAVNPVANKVYVANSSDNSVTVIDGASATSVATVPAGAGPQALGVNTVTNKIYVANDGSANVTVIDGASNTPLGNLPVGAGPQAIGINPVTNKVYVANFNSNTLSVIDGASNLVSATISVGNGPFAVAVNPVTNKIYVPDYNGNTVTVIDGSLNIVAATVATGGSEPYAVALNPLTNQVYVANYGIGGFADSLISVIDGLSNNVTFIGTPGYEPMAIAVNPVTNKIYVPNSASANLAVIDGATNTPASVADPNAQLPLAVALNPVTDKIYVVNFGTNNVTVIDGATFTVVATVSAGSGACAVAVNPVTNKIYVANCGEGRNGGIGNGNVTVIDGATNSTTTVTDPSAAYPFAVAVNPVTNQIYVANIGTSNVTVIDGATNTLTTVSAGNWPGAVAVNPGTNKIYVVNCGGCLLGGNGNVTVIDGASNSPIASLPVGSLPSAVAVNPVTNKIYVPNLANNNVTVIDGTTLTVVATVSTGTYPAAVDVNPVTNKIYVANGDGTVTVIDGATNAPTTVSAGASPDAVAVNPVTNKIYVANSGSANVTVIDGATNAPTTVSAGTDPIAVAVNPVTNEIYVANCGACQVGSSPFGNVTVIAEQKVNPIPLQAAIAGLPDNVTNSLTPSFNFVASSSFSPTAPPPDNVLFQVDTWQGPWSAGTSQGGGNFTGQTPPVQPGFHLIYAYATDGLEASLATDPSNVASPLVGNITAYGFLVTVPTASLSPTSLGFFYEQVGTTSAPQTVTLSDSGVQLNISGGITITGPNAGDFTQTTTCDSWLAPGTNCQIQVTFTPSVNGAESATLTVTDDSGGVAGATQTVALTGIGYLIPTATLAPPSLTFSSQPVAFPSAAQTAILSDSGGTLYIYGITITGPNASDFTQTNTCGTIQPIPNLARGGTLPGGPTPAGAGTLPGGSNCQISVTFTPSGTGAESATLNVMDNSGQAPILLMSDSPGLNPGYPTQTVALSGTGQAVPTAALAPATGLGFGSQPQGATSAPQTATLSDSGGPLTISGITITGANAGDFKQSSNCGATLAGGANCPIQVTFTPSVIGAESATLIVTDNSSGPTGSTQTLLLTGTGQPVPTAALTPGNLVFNNQAVGTTSAALLAKLGNSGTAVLTVSGIAITGANAADFKETDNCSVTLASGANCQIQVTFTPSVVGAESATLTVTDNSGGATGATQTVALSGTGQAPVPTATLTPTQGLSFGSQTLGTTSAAQPATLSVSGAALTISSITITGANAGDFKQTNACGTSLAVGVPCQIQVTFTPSTTSSESATLIVTDNSGGVPGTTQTIGLSGTGQQAVPTAALAPSQGLSFAGQSLGTTSAAQTATLSVSGGPLTISGITITGANAADFKQTNTCGATLATGANCQIQVTFTPSVTGAESATLTVTDNSGNVTGATQTIGLSGTGQQAVPTAALAPSNFNFGSLTVGTTSGAQTATLADSGAALTISGITITGPNAGDFKQTNACGATLAVGAQCQILVTFTPSVTGAESAILTVTDNSGNVTGATQTIGLSGTGQQAVPTAALAPSNFNFGSLTVGTSSGAQTATLADSGAALTISGISITGANAGDFKQTNTCSATLAVGAQCQILVTFAPSVTGSESATLNVTDNSGNVAGTTQTVTLIGDGMDFSMNASTSSMTVTAGNTANDALLITPEGGWTGTVSLTCSGAPLNSTCSISPSKLPMVSTGPVNVMLTVTTTASTAMLPRMPEFPRIPPRILWLGLLALLGFTALASMRRFRPQAAGVGLLALLMAVALGLASVSCGGGATTHFVQQVTGTPAGTYMLNVTATSNNMSHEMTVSLTVQ